MSNIKNTVKIVNLRIAQDTEEWNARRNGNSVNNNRGKKEWVNEEEESEDKGGRARWGWKKK
jgi:hypothetical protein